MKLDPRSLLVPIVALAVLGLTVQQTLSALHASGSWQPRRSAPHSLPDDPYTRIDRLMASSGQLAPERVQDPFVVGRARLGLGPETGPRPQPRLPKPPPPTPLPTLTSIVWDSDPWATIHYDGHEFSVRPGTVIADFKVKSISSSQVVLDHKGETLVLTLRPKGE